MLTLKELKGIVRKADFKRRLPSEKWVLESGGAVVVKERLDELTEISVYESGYVLYRKGIYATVFPLHACDEYIYCSEVDESYHLPVYVLENENWYIRLMMEGEDRLIHNQNNRMVGKVVSYSGVSEEWDVLRTTGSVLDDLVQAERTREVLGKILPLMTDCQREVMVRMYIDREEQVDIAESMGVTQQAISDMVRKAKKRVRKALQKEGIEKRRDM